MNIWLIILIIAIIFVSIDKTLTLLNINEVKHNFPNKDPISIEKNPLAKFFFKNFGLIGGTILYWFISIFTILLAVYLINSTLSALKISNSISISLYIIMLLYGFVIINNFYLFLKFSKIIP